jgi:hypothetical protein
VDRAATVGTSAKAADPSEWHELQRWLATEADREVMLDIEVARLIKAMDTSTIRARRDVGKVMGLTMANALLHQTHRERHKDTGAIVADMRDYRVAYELAGTALGHTAQTTVPDYMRRTYEAVRDSTVAGQFGPVPPTSAKVTERLGEARETVRRWLIATEQAGYIRNTNPGAGRVATWEADGKLPVETRSFLAPPVPLPPPLTFTLTMRDGKRWAVFPWSAEAPPVVGGEVGKSRSASCQPPQTAQPAHDRSEDAGGFGGYGAPAKMNGRYPALTGELLTSEQWAAREQETE